MRFKYLVLPLAALSDPKCRELQEKALNGVNIWELVAVSNNIAYLKREITQ